MRYRMLPYNYVLARENHETGMPLVRPLFFQEGDDDALLTRRVPRPTRSRYRSFRTKSSPHALRSTRMMGQA